MPWSSNAPAATQQISAGARSSPLSQKQVEEIQRELLKVGCSVALAPIFIETVGDLDKGTSLRMLDKTNFFTRELDDGVIKGRFRIAIHSAKDLPDPIPEGLTIAAITEGLTPADALVLREDATLDTLPNKAKIGSSSTRRETAVKTLREDLTFVDIRGNIGERLALMEKGEVDGVVVAEAALLRLGLSHLNRVLLPGETVPFQGQLAITTRQDDLEILEIFKAIDARVAG